VAATTLKRLSDMRWVKSDKSPELDQRLSWYRLREPLVRHHFQYRSARDQPLPLIVELLKAWYDPEERREQIVEVCFGQLMESPTIPPDWREGGLVPTVQAAAAGEAEAFMRLPAELADIVRAARTQSAEPASTTP
jgi:hypothetical protein